ncbi:alpha-L-rhamnosidase C-terminal domain-containing protein [Streptomyces sp. HNM1019]|uniref:alpha-L-rhamnosidase-related protein n=1 Tax=Streptomyces sp. HNM1019 TaxID=3424717 RepID=UPI003D779FB1
MAELTGDTAHRDRFRAAAKKLKDAFNKEFLGSDGHYRTAKDPEYRQASNCIPLAFGMVPAGAKASVTASLLADIEKRGNHLNTGRLGTSVLLRALSASGHPEVAHAVATQRTYPGWGHWFERGADTMWEYWPLDSRSHDHYFLGTIVQWLYENVAGPRPGDAGYRTFTVRPDARAGVDWARTELHTVRGPAAVSWSQIDKTVRLTVRVPVGATAEAHVPAANKGAAHAPAGAEYLRTEPGFAVYRAPHGTWECSGAPDVAVLDTDRDVLRPCRAAPGGGFCRRPGEGRAGVGGQWRAVVCRGMHGAIRGTQDGTGKAPMAARWVRGSVGALLAVTAVAGCDAGSDGKGKPEPESSATAEVALPLERYQLSGRDTERYQEATDLLAQRCMVDLGYTGFPRHPKEPHSGASLTLTAMSTQYGEVDLDSARRWGYGFDPKERAKQEPDGRAMTDAESGALHGEPRGATPSGHKTPPKGGCSGQAQRRLLKGVKDATRLWTYPARREERLDKAARRDPRVRRALRTWAQCVVEKGFKRYAAPDDAFRDPAWRRGQDGNTTRTRRELGTAVADVECKREHHTVAMWSTVLAERQRADIRAHQTTYDAVRRDLDTVRAAVRAAFDA